MSIRNYVGSLLRLASFISVVALVGLLAAIVLWFPVGTPGAQVTSRETVGAPELPEAAQTATLDWPQVQRDPQRTGYTPEALGTNFKVAWTYPFQPEKVYPQTQAIIYSGKVFVGTEMGNLYTIDAKTGAKVWVFKAGGPILNSVAAGDGKVFFGSLDGAVYALNATTGTQVWKKPLAGRLGFSTAPILADGKLILGGQNGVLYALEPSQGNLLWQFDAGAPILQTAAYDNGKVFFGAMNMYVYAINAANGTQAWRSAKLAGMAFKDYWPVAYAGKLLIRPMGSGGIQPDFPFKWFGSSSDWTWLAQYGPTVAAGNLTAVPDAVNAQNAVMARYRANPAAYRKTLVVLDQATGQETLVVPHWDAQTMHGATPPSCVDRNGKLVVPLYFIRSAWGRLDIASGRIVDILYDQTNYNGGVATPGDTVAGMGNSDENLNVTCSANLIFSMHTMESNANYTGAFDLDGRRWTHILPGQRNRQMSTATEGGGGNPASIADGMVYHISWHELIARTTR